MRKIVKISLFLVVLLLVSGCFFKTKVDQTPYYEKKLMAGMAVGDLNEVKEALDLGADMNEFKYMQHKSDSKYITNPMWVGFERRGWMEALYLAEIGAELNKYRGDDGNTYMTYLGYGDFENINRYIPTLLENGADPNLGPENGENLGDFILNSYRITDIQKEYFMDMIMNYGLIMEPRFIEIDVDSYGNQLLPKLVSLYIDEGIELALSDIELAVILGDSEIALSLMGTGNYNESEQDKLIRLTAGYCSKEVIEECLSTFSIDIELGELLFIASRAGNMEVVQYLVEKGADINYTVTYNHDIDVYSPLLIATVNNHVEVIAYLLEYNPKLLLNMSTGGTSGRTNELCAAVMNDNIEVIKLYETYLKEINPELAEKMIVTASYYGIYNSAVYMIESGYIDEEPLEVLEDACFYFNVDQRIIKMLIDKVDDVNAILDAEGEMGLTSMGHAIQNGSTDTIKTLLEAGVPATIEHIDKALYENNFEALKLFVEAGVDVNSPAVDGYVPIVAASARSNTTMKYLIDHGADYEFITPDDGASILIVAVRAGKVDNVETLLALDVDTSHKDDEGYTAYDYAKKEGYPPMLEVFEAFGINE